MSLIGTLEQLNLSVVLQGIETYGKTGLLVIKHEVQWVELYFRDGRLMCVGPMGTNATLGERLIQAGVISPQALQEALFTIGIEQPGETRVALTLMDLGYVSHEGLRAWATKEANEVIQVLLMWQSGEIYFKDGWQPPVDRLLVALSPAALLPPAGRAIAVPQPQHVQIEATPSVVREQAKASVMAPPAQMSAAQLIASSTVSFASPASSVAVTNMLSNADAPVPTPLAPPRSVTMTLPPKRIDTSFMKPEMVLLPVDVSTLRDQNLQVQITPDQWRLLTRVDGRTSLQAICQELAMAPGMVCQVAGELIALGLVNASMPVQQATVKELSPVSRDMIAAGLANGYVTPGYAAATAQLWDAYTPTTEDLPPSFDPSIPFETKSQWGNGGNGATFVPGRGWIATPQPLQPLQPSGPLYSTQNFYAHIGARR